MPGPHHQSLTAKLVVNEMLRIVSQGSCGCPDSTTGATVNRWFFQHVRVFFRPILRSFPISGGSRRLDVHKTLATRAIPRQIWLNRAQLLAPAQPVWPPSCFEGVAVSPSRTHSSSSAQRPHDAGDFRSSSAFTRPPLAHVVAVCQGYVWPEWWCCKDLVPFLATAWLLVWDSIRGLSPRNTTSVLHRLSFFFFIGADSGRGILLSFR